MSETIKRRPEDMKTCSHKYANGRWAIVKHGNVGVCAMCGMIFD